VNVVYSKLKANTILTFFDRVRMVEIIYTYAKHYPVTHTIPQTYTFLVHLFSTPATLKIDEWYLIGIFKSYISDTKFDT
jgi:hypothetical protein